MDSTSMMMTADLAKLDEDVTKRWLATLAYSMKFAEADGETDLPTAEPRQLGAVYAAALMDGHDGMGVVYYWSHNALWTSPHHPFARTPSVASISTSPQRSQTFETEFLSHRLRPHRHPISHWNLGLALLDGSTVGCRSRHFFDGVSMGGGDDELEHFEPDRWAEVER